MSRKRPAMRAARPANLGSMLMVTVVVAMILGVVFFKSRELNEKKLELEKKDSHLIERIEEQHERTREIEEYREPRSLVHYDGEAAMC